MVPNQGPGHPTLVIIRAVEQIMRENLFNCKSFKAIAARDNFLISALC